MPSDNLIGITRAAYTNIENGKRETDFTTLKKLASIFDVSTDYLLENTNDPMPPDVKKEAPAVLETAEALRMYAEGKKGGPLTQEELNGLDDFVDIYIKSINK